MKLRLSLPLFSFFFMIPLLAQAQATITTTRMIAVPYISQVPDGRWVAPWNEACEEASISMLKHYYAGTKRVAYQIKKADIRELVAWENKTFHKNDDTNAEEMLQMIQHVGGFKGTIKRQPTLEKIKAELDQNHPVIALLNMYTFYGKRPRKDSYHTVVLTGYDDQKKVFRLQDPAQASKKSSPYGVLLRALHDYNPKSKEADGEPTVLFTAPL